MDQPTATALAAFVGVASAVATAVLKDFVFVRWHRRLDKSADDDDVLRLYVAPLAAVSEKLVWRFSEIFLDRRHQFLKAVTLPLVFNEYKRQSTLYRIATLIGWMRAIQLELNALPKAKLGLADRVGAALEKVRKALGDGPEVEVLRLNRLLTTWDLGEVPAHKTAQLAAELERKLYAEAGNELKHDARYLQNLERSEKVRVCRSLADFLAQAQGRARLTNALLEEKVESAIAGMSYREALIYRDWQDAIGDAMLIRDEDSERRYKIVGYAEFASILAGPEPWFEVFRESIIDIDFDEVDVMDYRATQLSFLSSAVAETVSALSEAGHSDLLSKETGVVARQLIQLHSQGGAVR